MNIIDVAGLVPDAHLGKGMGNQFLDNLREADALIQVIDLSGKTDLEGNPSAGSDPGEEIVFLEKEISYWIAGILKRNWAKIKGRNLADVADALAGLKVGFNDVEHVANMLNLPKERIEWNDGQIFEFADAIRKATKPIIVAANKSDLPESRANLEKLKKRFPEKKILPCCAAAELALRKASQKGAIEYVPGNREFKITGNVDEKQKAGLDTLAGLVKENGSGVQEIINHAVFGLLGMIVVYPVEDEHKYANHMGAVLPDAVLLKREARHCSSRRRYTPTWQRISYAA
jgi:ribosome-binding ATPase YchF (GTP1/OBG family)